MLETPHITQTTDQLTAFIHLAVPRREIQKVMGPGINEVMETVAAQGKTPAGPWFAHHLRMDPAVFEFNICVPVTTPVVPQGRVKPGHLAAATVARTVYRGPYEGLYGAWSEFDAWVAANRYNPRGDLWECYVLGPEATADPANYRTELNRPLRMPD